MVSGREKIPICFDQRLPVSLSPGVTPDANLAPQDPGTRMQAGRKRVGQTGAFALAALKR
jgi:hypothetical protein